MKTNKNYYRSMLIALLCCSLVFMTACLKEEIEVSIDDSSIKPVLTDLSKDLQNAVDAGLKKYGGKGISVAIHIPEIGLWTGVAGNSHSNIPITRNTLFNAGSITKNFTAVTILKLVEDNKLSLNDSIHKYVKDFENIDHDITVEQLLSHTGGIFDIVDHPGFWTNMFNNSKRSWSMEDMVSKFTLTPYFNKGEGWHYSNTGYVILRMIIEEITGEDISSVYDNMLFNPLELDNSILFPQEQITFPIAHGWFDLNGDSRYDDLSTIDLEGFYNGIGGIVYTTAIDLATWTNNLFNEQIVLNSNQLEKMLDFHSPLPGEKLAQGYGLGAMNFNPALFNGLKVWGHSGNALGYAAGCFYLPDYQISIGILVNTEDGETMYSINNILSIIQDYF